MPRFIHAGAILLFGTLLTACEDGVTSIDEDILDCDRVNRYSIGSTVTGSLTSSDCIDPTGVAVDYYRFRVNSGRTVQVTMTSRTIVPYLEILDEDGRLVTDEDEGSEGLSQIEEYLDEGTYYIAASTYEGSEYGDYRLTSDD